MGKSKKRSSVRHTRAIQVERHQRPSIAPPDEQVQQQLTALIHPATLNQVSHFHSLGLRERLLTLPVMVALVLSMVWRCIGSVSELTRLLNREGFLWSSPVQVSQQALSERLRTFPAQLFLHVLQEVLPQMHQRFQARIRPLPEELAWALQHYERVWAVDGSTLDALLRKVGLLRDEETHPLAGRMSAILDVCSRLPHWVFYEEDTQAHDQRFWPRLVEHFQAGTLLLFDLGYTNFTHFAELTKRKVTFITRAKSNLAYRVVRVLHESPHLRDRIVWIGQGDDRQQVRLVEVLYKSTWYRYLTNELDLKRLPPLYVVALYWQRWRIEDAYKIVKRLLGLAYFWVGSINGVQLQLWATWLLYAVLVDLTDAVAEALNRPFEALSLQMVYRGLYHFTQAYHRGEAQDPVLYLAQEAKELGILKRKTKRSKFRQLALTFEQAP